MESADTVGREANQCAIAVVEPTENQRSDKRLEDGRRDEDGGCCEVDSVLRSSLTLSGTRECASPGLRSESTKMPRSRTEDTGATVVEPTDGVVVGSRC